VHKDYVYAQSAASSGRPFHFTGTDSNLTCGGGVRPATLGTDTTFSGSSGSSATSGSAGGLMGGGGDWGLLSGAGGDSFVYARSFIAARFLESDGSGEDGALYRGEGPCDDTVDPRDDWGTAPASGGGSASDELRDKFRVRGPMGVRGPIGGACGLAPRSTETLREGPSESIARIVLNNLRRRRRQVRGEATK
jgi:hypothetical protein